MGHDGDGAGALGAVWEQPGKRLVAWALQWLRAWTLQGGGEVTEGFEGKSQLGLCVEWVGEGCRPQGRLPAGGPGLGFVRDPGPGLPDPCSLTLLLFLE